MTGKSRHESISPRARYSNHFVIHRQLLCFQSRFFNANLNRYLDGKLLADIVTEVEGAKEENEYFDSRECNPLLQEKDVPPGYVPTWVMYARSYRDSNEAESEDTLEEGLEANDDAIVLPTECAQIFTLFVHWLYTGELKTIDHGIDLESDHICVLLYALAERMDVPHLRRACYRELRESYKSSQLPNQDVIGAVVDECSLESRLRAYFVRLFAHAVVSQKIDERGNNIIDEYTGFADDVAKKVLQCLRLHLVSLVPFKIEQFDDDQSDLDFEEDSDWSSEYDSGSEVNSDCVMSVTDNGETDSLFADTVEDSQDIAPDSVSPQLAVQLGLDGELNALSVGYYGEEDEGDEDSPSRDAHGEDTEGDNGEILREEEKVGEGNGDGDAASVAKDNKHLEDPEDTFDETPSKEIIRPIIVSSAKPPTPTTHERFPISNIGAHPTQPSSSQPQPSNTHSKLSDLKSREEKPTVILPPYLGNKAKFPVKQESPSEDGVLVQGYPVIKRKRTAHEADKENQSRKRSATNVVDLT